MEYWGSLRDLRTVVAVAPTVYFSLRGDAQGVRVERAAGYLDDVFVGKGGDHGGDEAVFGGAVAQAAVVAAAPGVEGAVGRNGGAVGAAALYVDDVLALEGLD